MSFIKALGLKGEFRECKAIEKIIDSLPEWIYVIDENEKYTYTNKEVKRIFGFSSKEIIGKHFSYTFDKEQKKERIKEYLDLFYKKKKFRNFIVKNKNKKGDVIYTRVSAIPIFDKKNFKGFIGAERDITKLVQAEEKLRESEAKYKEIVENANSIILKMDKDCNVTFLNEFGQKFFGYSKKEILGKSVIGTIVPVELRELLKKVCTDPRNYAKNENENMTKDGRIVFVSWTNKPIFKDGKIIGTISIGNDITYRKKLEDELEKKVQERTKELTAKIEELETTLKFVEFREVRLSVLKKLLVELVEEKNEHKRKKIRERLIEEFIDNVNK